MSKAIYHSEAGDIELAILESKDGKLALAHEDGTVKVEGVTIGNGEIGTASLVEESKPAKPAKEAKE